MWLFALAVFVPFAVLYMGQAIRINHIIYAGICLLAGVYFAFHG